MVHAEIFVLLFFLSIALWVAAYINARIGYPTALNRRRFRLFELRDRLALLAMGGNISEDSFEYEFMIRRINRMIRMIGDFRMTEYVRFVNSLATDSQFKADVGRVIDGLRQNENDEYKSILEEYFIVSGDILHYILMPYNAMLPIVIVALNGISVLGLEFSEKQKEVFSDRLRRTKYVAEAYQEYQKRVHAI